MQLKNILTCAAFAAVTIATASSAFAHDVVGGSENYKKRTLNHIQKVENYMAKNYNLSLDENVTVVLAKDTKEFKLYKERLNFSDHELKFGFNQNRAFAVQDKPIILLNKKVMSDKEFDYYLTHELVHRYQVQEAKKKNLSVDKNAVFTEGMAGLIATKMSKFYVRCAADYGANPSYEMLKPAKNFNLAVQKWTPLSKKNQLEGRKIVSPLTSSPTLYAFDGILSLSRYYAQKVEQQRQKQGLPPAVFVE